MKPCLKTRMKRMRCKNLPEEFRTCFRRTKLLLCEDLPNRHQRKQVLRDFRELLETASMEQMSLDDIFPEGYDVFYRDLVDGLQSVSEGQKRKRIICYRVVIIIIFLAFGLLTLSASGLFQIATQGIAYFEKNMNRYSYSCDVLPEGCNFSVDLKNLEMNIGKEIYRDEYCYIEISDIQYDDGKYRIFFRSHGSYDLNKAVLVSGVKHYAAENRYYTNEIHAMLTGTYYGVDFDCVEAGMTGLSYRDGDDFGFYILLPDYIQNTDVNEATVCLRLTGLLKNQWMKK